MKSRTGQWPSIGVLLFAIGLLLVTPLLGIGQVQWRQAGERVDAANEISASALRLEYLLRLRSGLSAEQLSASWEVVNQGQVGEVARSGMEMVGLDFAQSMNEDQAFVDRYLELTGDADLIYWVAAVRTDNQESQNVFELGRGYDAVIDEIVARTNRELLILTEAAADAGDADVALAAQLAEAAASVEIVTAGLGASWAAVAAAPYVAPFPQQVRALADNVAAYQERVGRLERILPQEGAVADAWATYTASPARLSSLLTYQATVTQYIAEGVPEPTEDANIDLAAANLPEVMAVAGRLSDTLLEWRVMSQDVSAVVDASLLDVEAAAERSLAAAGRDRQVSLLWVLASTTVMIGASIGLVVLVARPLQRLADTAQELSHGRLDSRLEERGPKEIRLGARALNDAMASLQTVEAQAIALAEERLDDGVLSAAAPGQIGRSLQAAVDRLAGSLTEREEFQQRLAHEASHDGLTKLANRNAVLRHLEQAMARTQRSDTSLALLFIDLDEFKEINDRHGHPAGDQVLRETARRLVNSIRDGDLAGRLGGDEFLVVAEPVADIEAATDLAERVRESVTRPITIDGVSVIPSISIGIGLADGLRPSEELLRDADLAVYRAKSRGKGVINVCDDNLRGEARARDEMELAIREAIDTDQFRLHYQAAVNAATHEINSFEALLRWDRPGYGPVPPGVFIPVAERTDLVLEIDRWVLDAAISQLAAWTDDPILGQHPIALNVSSRHLGSGELYSDVQQALDRHGVSPHRLVLEVTETAILEDMTGAGRELSQLRGHGVRIALDDFGTGYMSLAHLRGLPVDTLKIDQSFVADMESDADYTLIHLIVKTGHLLNVTVTAEGVETERQAGLLAEMGCDHLQGYLFSHPIDPDATRRLVHDGLTAGATSS